MSGKRSSFVCEKEKVDVKRIKRLTNVLMVCSFNVVAVLAG
jgi:hypothetical protein